MQNGTSAPADCNPGICVPTNINRRITVQLRPYYDDKGIEGYDTIVMYPLVL
jgi:hypothetical protein